MDFEVLHICVQIRFLRKKSLLDHLGYDHEKAQELGIKIDGERHGYLLWQCGRGSLRSNIKTCFDSGTMMCPCPAK
jgi:hypothetical protein